MEVEKLYPQLLRLLMHAKVVMLHVTEELQLTPVQGMMLLLFENEDGMSMQTISEIMGCDASNVTGLVDRLDSQGLIHRTPDPQDRRIKLITLSQQGLEVRSHILQGLNRAEKFNFKSISMADREALLRITAELTS
jgi:DNA-binding MarR family transcriptional regulator